MNKAITARLADVITLCERLKAVVVSERPEALLPTFPLMRLGLDADAMVNALEGHLGRIEAAPAA